MKVDLRIATFTATLVLIVFMMGLAAGERPNPKTHTVTIENMKIPPGAHRRLRRQLTLRAAHMDRRGVTLIGVDHVTMSFELTSAR